jgi:hypothetical protein
LKIKFPQKKKELDILMKLHNDAVSLEKTRINAIKDIVLIIKVKLCPVTLLL